MPKVVMGDLKFLCRFIFSRLKGRIGRTNTKLPIFLPYLARRPFGFFYPTKDISLNNNNKEEERAMQREREGKLEKWL